MNFPTRYIHEPWTAPLQVQRAAKCLVGIDYPKPMINHYMAAKVNQVKIDFRESHHDQMFLETTALRTKFKDIQRDLGLFKSS